MSLFQKLPFRPAALAFCGLSLAAVPAISSADPVPQLSDILTNSGIFAAGFVSAGYTAGFNKGETFSGRVFETVSSTNTFQLNQAALVLAHLPDEGFGAKLLVVGGTDAKIFNAFYGSNLNDFAVFIADVQYKHGPLTVVAGRFPALSGYELAPIALNDNISRSLVLATAQPVPLTGVRLSYELTPELTGVVAVSNSDGIGIQAAVDDNKQKTLEFGGSYAPIKAFKLAVYDYYGVETAEHGGKNDILDVVATFQATEKLQFAFNGDYDHFQHGTSAGLNANPDLSVATTLGADAYLNYKFTPKWGTSLRAEYLRQKLDTSDQSNYLKEATLTGRYTATKNFRVLTEVRFDKSSLPYFADGSDPETSAIVYSKHDSEVRVNAIYSFGGL